MGIMKMLLMRKKLMEVQSGHSPDEDGIMRLNNYRREGRE